MPHIPVLLQDVLSFIENSPNQKGFLLDGTFGRGGHTKAILDAYPQIQVIGFDRDIDAINYGQDHYAEEVASGRLYLIHANYVDVLEKRSLWQEVTNQKGFQFILLDLGVSSPQLDEAGRGFSFYQDGPLDMRMNQTRGEQAKDIVNEWSEQDLIELFQQKGEVRRPHKVVSAIIRQRKEEPFSTTGQLSQLIESCMGWRKKGHHPATQYFLALRMEVNQELEQVKECIPPLIECLEDQGRLMIITFHSLEDRIVKYALKDQLHQGYLVNKKVVQPKWSEVQGNARARSAKLRVYAKGEKDEKKV